MSVSTTFGVTLTTVETLAVNVPAVSGTAGRVTHSGYSASDSTYTAATTVPVTKCAYFSKALAAGVATIDLTTLSGTNGATVDLTGLKVQFARFKNPATNANTITVTFGASNGYLLAGTAWKVILSPGQSMTYEGNDAAPDVGPTTKAIDLAGTASQALECSLVAG